MKRLLLVIAILTFVLATAFLPVLQESNQWRAVFQTILGILVFFLGAPLTQYIKNALNVQDKIALVLTAAVSVVVAIGEVLLSGVLTLSNFTIDTFPFAFTTVFSVATVYYQLLKESEGIFGQKLMLPSKEPNHDELL